MADPPRPSPRQPPPLPPLPLRSVTAPITEPFRDLTSPEDRAADTQRTRRDEMPPPALDALTESTAQLLRRELALVRETLPTLPSGALLPVTSPPPSRARQATSAVLTLGKYTAVAAGLLGFAVQVATIWRPDLVGPLQMLQRLLGGP